MSKPRSSVAQTIRASPPVDFSTPYDPAWAAGRVILITGGASGFGAAFVEKWAGAGAFIVVGDLDAEKGAAHVSAVRSSTNNPNVHFVPCDVTDWQSQVRLFRAALALSPHGGLDAVVANAGVAGRDPFLRPAEDDLASADEPAPPNLAITAVNYTGVLYTAHLALFHLPRNPGSAPSSPSAPPSARPRDRHLLLVGSMASLAALPGSPQYTASKHAVLGLFRSLRASSFPRGVRVNIVCPYFVRTPLIGLPARVLLAGGAMGGVDDVLDAATRLVADARIAGRSLFVGPRARLIETDGEGGDGEVTLVPALGAAGGDKGKEAGPVWEAGADDWEEAEVFTRRMVGLLSAIERARGWAGWAKDLLAAAGYALFGARR